MITIRRRVRARVAATCLALLAMATWGGSAIRAAKTAEEKPVGGSGRPHTVKKPSVFGDADQPPTKELAWHTDYRDVLRAAQQGKTMAMIWFFDPDKPAANERFQRDVLDRPEVAERLARVACARLPLDAQMPVRASSGQSGAEDNPVPDQTGEQEQQQVQLETKRLLDHGAFAELAGEPGIVIIDLTDPESPHYHHVVSVLPALHRRIRVIDMTALLDLPPGSLTQRTLTWAVMTHPERPQSAAGKVDPTLIQEAQQHSRYQARLRVQGHHNWGFRFQRLMSRLPGNLMPQEVCAESWPGQRLVDAAEECVRSWRQSSGHWEAVRSRHALFGYDMKLGSNGVWYATGVFGRSR